MSRLGCHGYQMMAALGSRESLDGVRGDTGTWRECVPLHERTGLNFATDRPVETWEMGKRLDLA